MELFDALKAKDHERVRALLKLDPSLADARMPDGASALRLAIYARSPECVRALLDAGARVDVYDAAAMGDAARVRALVASDPGLASAAGGDGTPALHLAAHFGHVETLQALIATGAPVDLFAPSFGNRPLHAACAGGQEGAVRALLDASASVDQPDRNGYAPLHIAAANGSATCVRLLVERGASRHARMKDGRTAMDVARERGNMAAVAALGAGSVQARSG